MYAMFRFRFEVGHRRTPLGTSVICDVDKRFYNGLHERYKNENTLILFYDYFNDYNTALVLYVGWSRNRCVTVWRYIMFIIFLFIPLSNNNVMYRLSKKFFILISNRASRLTFATMGVYITYYFYYNITYMFFCTI